MMTLKFFELGWLPLRHAAEVAGYSKRAFIDVLGEYGIPVAHYPARDCLPKRSHGKDRRRASAARRSGCKSHPDQRRPL